MALSPRAAALIVLTALLASGCHRDSITHAHVRKEPAAAATARTAGLSWTLPQGWTETAGPGMRYATIKPSLPGNLEISVIALPGAAGGEVANVNRWRGQLGLPALDQTALLAAREVLPTEAGAVSLYDFAASGNNPGRLIVGLTSAGEKTWFLKMAGDASAVAASRGDFLHLIASLRP